MDGTSPLKLALVNDYEVVVFGLMGALEPHAHRVRVVELDANNDVGTQVDITLFDNFAQPQVTAGDIDDVLNDPLAGKVAIYTWNLEPELVRTALDKGVAGYLSKTMSADELVEALLRIHDGETVVPPHLDAGEQTGAGEQNGTDGDRGAGGQTSEGNWPGRTEGLTVREAEVIALITQGYSNKEVAERAYLSLNTIKAYIRSAYRKMGVASRSQAVLWGLEHGMSPDHSRYRRTGR